MLTKIIVVVFTIIFTIFYSNGSPIINESRGIGIGRSRNILEIPFVASLYNGTMHFCGAVLLSNEWALTCSHCVQNQEIENFFVRIGSSYRTHGGELIKVTEKILHPSYRQKLLLNNFDIAILKLEKFSNNLISQYAMLPDCKYPEPCVKGDTVEISGWGENNVIDPIARTKLQSTVLSLTSHEVCSRKLSGGKHLQTAGWDITNTMFCAGHKKGGKDACQGDSGGPIVCKKTGHLIGLITAGDGCADVNKPGIYTSVANIDINRWIHNVTITKFGCSGDEEDVVRSHSDKEIFKDSYATKKNK